MAQYNYYKLQLANTTPICDIKNTIQLLRAIKYKRGGGGFTYTFLIKKLLLFFPFRYIIP